MSTQTAPGQINQVLGNVVDVEFGAGTLAADLLRAARQQSLD